jgi:ATP synthase protein I
VGLAFRPGLGADARTVARAFYVGEAAKLGVTIVLFALVLKFVKVSGGALFGAYAATFLVYWMALANALPPLLGGKPRARRT